MAAALVSSLASVADSLAVALALVAFSVAVSGGRSEEHTSELQTHSDLVCRLLLDKNKQAAAVVRIGQEIAGIISLKEYAV